MDYKRHFIFYSAIIFLALVLLIFTSKLIRNEKSFKKYIYNSRSNDHSSNLKDLFFKRKTHLKKTCQKYSNILLPEYAIANTKIGQYNPSDLWIIYHGKFDRFYEFKDQHISLCLIPKVASTSQTELMRTLAKSEIGTTENWKVERYIHQNITEDSLSQDYRIMIVRHPFERLLSAYLWFLGSDEKKNKLCTTKHHNNKHKKHHNKAPNCPSVVADILNVLYSNKTEENTNKVYYETGTSLSFSQFVSFLILGSRSDQMMVSLSRQIEFNIHWMPYWRLCSPCHIHAMPTAIVKMDVPEQFSQELDYVFEESGMAELLKKHKQNLGHSNRTPKKVVSQRAKTFFATLTKKQIMNLHFKYRHDFELFDYSIEPYLTYATEK